MKPNVDGHDLPAKRIEQIAKVLPVGNMLIIGRLILSPILFRRRSSNDVDTQSTGFLIRCLQYTPSRSITCNNERKKKKLTMEVFLAVQFKKPVMRLHPLTSTRHAKVIYYGICSSGIQDV